MGAPPRPANPKAAIATAVVSILSGWATAVIATDLITGWWRSDRLFCVAVGFLTAVSAAALIGGLIALLLRRRMSRLLIVVGAIVALLIFSSLFVAGAKLPPVVYAIPVLPLASIAAGAAARGHARLGPPRLELGAWARPRPVAARRTRASTTAAVAKRPEKNRFSSTCWRAPSSLSSRVARPAYTLITTMSTPMNVNPITTYCGTNGAAGDTNCGSTAR